jgi:hypothetical protein
MDIDLMRALRARGVDVTSALEERMIGIPDEQHLQYATQQGRILYSFNARDYLVLHDRFLATGLSHAGIILGVQTRFSIGEQMRRLLAIIDAKSAEEMRDQVEFLSAWEADR